VDAVPAGTVAGDFIMVAGVAATTPVFLYGIPYFHNTATTGTFLGINRTQNYVVANGVAAGGAPLSLPMLRAALSRVEQSLGTDALKSQVWHAHPAQIQAYEEMGFAKQEILMNNGKMPGFDGLTANVGQFTIAGREVVRNIHADNTRIDFMEFGSWLKVVWGKAPFWFKNRSGQWVFQIYDPASGNPTANEGCYYVDARQYAVDNPQAQEAVVTAPTMQPATVIVKSTPPGADINVDGKFMGNTPSTIQLTPGDHVVTVEKEGLRPWERGMTITAGGNITIDATLDKP